MIFVPRNRRDLLFRDGHLVLIINNLIDFIMLLNLKSEISVNYRQIILKGFSNGKLFDIVKQSVAKGLELICTPRVDKANESYYWIGVRNGANELDFKLLVNKSIENYILSYLKGEDSLPEVIDTNPQGNIVNADEWLQAHYSLHLTSAESKIETLENGAETNYLETKLVYKNGKMIYPAVSVNDAMDLLSIEK